MTITLHSIIVTAKELGISGLLVGQESGPLKFLRSHERLVSIVPHPEQHGVFVAVLERTTTASDDDGDDS